MLRRYFCRNSCDKYQKYKTSEQRLNSAIGRVDCKVFNSSGHVKQKILTFFTARAKASAYTFLIVPISGSLHSAWPRMNAALWGKHTERLHEELSVKSLLYALTKFYHSLIVTRFNTLYTSVFWSPYYWKGCAIVWCLCYCLMSILLKRILFGIQDFCCDILATLWRLFFLMSTLCYSLMSILLSSIDIILWRPHYCLSSTLLRRTLKLIFDSHVNLRCPCYRLRPYYCSIFIVLRRTSILLPDLVFAWNFCELASATKTLYHQARPQLFTLCLWKTDKILKNDVLSDVSTVTWV